MKQNIEVFEAGVLHPLTQAVILAPRALLFAAVAVLLLLGTTEAERVGVGVGVIVAVRVVAASGVERRHFAALGT